MLDSLEIAERSNQISDIGPYYNEFLADHIVKEPWNAYSSLLFFLPIIFWLIRLKGNYRKHQIIILLLPLLFLNGLGSTLYHAFRSHSFYFYLDILPAAIMSFILASYFWIKILKTKSKAILIVCLFYAAGWGIRAVLGKYESLIDFGPNMSYLFTGAAFLIPMIIYLISSNCKNWRLVVGSILFLVTALIFRSLDYPTENVFKDWLPQGTHFLWHVFSVLSVFTLGYYLVLDKLNQKKI